MAQAAMRAGRARLAGMLRGRALSTGANKQTTIHLECVAEALEARGDIEGALRRLRVALSIKRSELGDHPLTALTLSQIAQCLRVHGDGRGALSSAGEATAIYERAFGRRHRAVATGLLDMAAISRDLDEREEALRMAEEALSIRRELLGEGADTAEALSEVGALLRGLGRREEALGALDAAVDAYEASLGGGHRLCGEALAKKAALLMDLERPEEALACAERALAIAEGIGEPARSLADAARLQRASARDVLGIREAPGSDA